VKKTRRLSSMIFEMGVFLDLREMSHLFSKRLELVRYSKWLQLK
jgi:hypothetical protein